MAHHETACQAGGPAAGRGGVAATGDTSSDGDGYFSAPAGVRSPPAEQTLSHGGRKASRRRKASRAALAVAGENYSGGSADDDSGGDTDVSDGDSNGDGSVSFK